VADARPLLRTFSNIRIQSPYNDTHAAMTLPTWLALRRSPRSRATVVRPSFWFVFAIAGAFAGQACGNGQKQCAPVNSSPSCTGPTTLDACLEANGCSLGPTCSRVACQAIQTMSACVALSTCNWVSSPGICVSNTERDPCASATEEVCKSNNNCSWQVTCNGQLKNCYGLSETQCAAIPHCYMETAPHF